MEKSLEKIFWKDGKFQDKNGKEVNPKPIGPPKVLTLTINMNSKQLEENSISKKEDLIKISEANLLPNESSEINAYSQFTYTLPDCTGITIPIQFYKI